MDNKENCRNSWQKSTMFSPERFLNDTRSFSYFDSSSKSPGSYHQPSPCYVAKAKTFSRPESEGGRPVIPLRSGFRVGDQRDRKVGGVSTGPASSFGKYGCGRQTASEPATPAVIKDRGLRPSDLSDPHKKEFLTNLTTRVFHLALVSSTV